MGLLPLKIDPMAITVNNYSTRTKTFKTFSLF